MNQKYNYRKMICIYIIVIMAMITFASAASKSVTVFSEKSEIENRKVIVIDAGHGGVDGGATSSSGVLESKTNLEIAIRLRDVCRLLGIKTIMIRTEDISVYTSGQTIAAKKVSDLKERVRIVNEQPDCILISIHQNYFSDNKYSGAQIFYNKNQEAKQIASLLQAAFIKHLNPENNRQIKNADGIYLMQHINHVGLLVECGFISNNKEDLLLQSKEYQQKIAIVIGSVISSYLNT